MILIILHNLSTTGKVTPCKTKSVSKYKRCWPTIKFQFWSSKGRKFGFEPIDEGVCEREDTMRNSKECFVTFRGSYCEKQTLKSRCTGFGRWCERTFYYCCTDSQTLEHFFWIGLTYLIPSLPSKLANFCFVPLFTCFYSCHSVFLNCQSRIEHVQVDLSAQNAFMQSTCNTGSNICAKTVL